MGRFWLIAVTLFSLAGGTAVARPVDKTITVDLQQAELDNVIRLLADVGRVNVVVADDVKGKVTLKLKNVSWRVALDIVLKSGGYGAVEEDDVIWVTSQARIDADTQRALDLEAAHELKGPLQTRVIPVNYANATSMAELIRPLLTPRGRVSVDVRNNVVIVTDVQGAASLH